MDIERYKAENIEKSHRFFIDHITNGSAVLEVGSATGTLTCYLTIKKECAVTCIEIDPKGAEICSGYARRVVLGNIEDDYWVGELAGQSFDFIVMGDVLEHLRDPEKTLGKIKPFLSSGGLLLTSIPNIAHSAVVLSLLKGRFDYQTTGLLDHTHIHFFTRRSIAKAFGNAGWHCVDEKLSLASPAFSGLPYGYCSNLLLALFLACRRDAHTYQFKHAWQKSLTNNRPVIDILRFKRGRRPFIAFWEMIKDIAAGLLRRVRKPRTP